MARWCVSAVTLGKLGLVQDCVRIRSAFVCRQKIYLILSNLSHLSLNFFIAAERLNVEQ